MFEVYDKALELWLPSSVVRLDLWRVQGRTRIRTRHFSFSLPLSCSRLNLVGQLSSERIFAETGSRGAKHIFHPILNFLKAWPDSFFHFFGWKMFFDVQTNRLELKDARVSLSLSLTLSVSPSFSNSHTHLHNLSLPLTYPHSLSIFHSLSLSNSLSLFL